MGVDLAEIALHLDRGERSEAGKAIDRALHRLHGSGETRALCTLHKLAARYWQDDPRQVAFHRTHAYVYALEGGFAEDTHTLFDALEREDRI